VLHGVGLGGVGRWAVRLGAGQGGHTGQARKSLQTLGTMTTGRHASVGLQASGQWGEGKVALGLMRHSSWVQQAYHLRGGIKGNSVMRIENRGILLLRIHRQFVY